MISIYTDGSSGAGGGKPGGWAWVIVRDETEVLATDYGGDPSTTNNQMELTAAIRGMQHFKLLVAFRKIRTGETLELVSDSQYTLGIVSGKYTPAVNVDLAEQAKMIGNEHRAAPWGLQLRWVRGHLVDEKTGQPVHPWNWRCDSLAGRGKRESTPAHILAKLDAKRSKRKVKTAA